MLRLYFSEEVSSPQKYWSADPRRGEGTKASNNLGIGITIKCRKVPEIKNISVMSEIYASQNRLIESHRYSFPWQTFMVTETVAFPYSDREIPWQNHIGTLKMPNWLIKLFQLSNFVPFSKDRSGSPLRSAE